MACSAALPTAHDRDNSESYSSFLWLETEARALAQPSPPLKEIPYGKGT